MDGSSGTYPGSGDKAFPAATAPATGGTPYFKIIGTGKFVEGNEDSFDYYDVIACAVTYAS